MKKITFMHLLKRTVKEIIACSVIFYLKISYKLFGINLVNRYVAITPLTFTIPEVLNFFGAKVGKDCNIKNIFIDNALLNYSNLTIGNNVYIGKNVFFDLAGEIIIEDESVIAANVQFYTHEDVGDRVLKVYIKRKVSAIKVKKGSYIGGGAIVLYGTLIESKVVIGSGSIVKGKLESGYIYAGVPAKKIRKLEE
jgi:acetyltransferase-like isoleucine patch superfamily enzyme